MYLLASLASWLTVGFLIGKQNYYRQLSPFWLYIVAIIGGLAGHFLYRIFNINNDLYLLEIILSSTTSAFLLILLQSIITKK